MTTTRSRARSKFSVFALIIDHYDTLRHYDTGRVVVMDYVVYVGLPLSGVAVGWWKGAHANNVPEVLAASAIFTGLIFSVFMLLFDLSSKADGKIHSGYGRVGVELTEQLRANVSYAVLLGIVMTALLGVAAMFGNTDEPLPMIPTLLIVFLGSQMLLTIFMILKRIRAIYVVFGKAQPEHLP